MNLRNKRILVMGLGIHGGGLGVARFLAAHGADVTVTDLRDPELLADSLAQLAGFPIRLVLGEHREQDFRNAEIVVRNPGVPHTSRYLQIAREAGATIEMEMSLFFRLCPAPILAITGTKGKTTTTLLTAAMIRAQYPDTVAAGNLRVSALEQLPHLRPDTPVVLELSSFALEGLGEAHLSPGFAAITNLSADHLDRYETMAAYAEAKRQIYAWQQPDDVIVRSTDDPGTQAFFAGPTQSRSIWFANQLQSAPHGEPLVAWNADTLVLQSGTSSEVILSAGDIQLRGQHNRTNIAAATALAHTFGISPANIRSAVQGFIGVEHRLELVRNLHEVQYINDTTATAPDAAIAALHSFTQPIILIAGGTDKNLPFAALAHEIAGRVKALVLLKGSATEKLIVSLTPPGPKGTPHPSPHPDGTRRGAGGEGIHGPFEDFTAAIEQAQQLAEAGDVVLLSPGCASFGMFRNEFHRGEEFRRIVAGLR